MLTQPLNEATDALHATFIELSGQKGLGLQDRDALANNQQHALAKLLGKGGFAEKVAGIADPEQQISYAEKFSKTINRDEPDRRSSTAMQKAFIERFISSLRENAETVVAALPVINGKHGDFADTVPDFPTTVKANLGSPIEVKAAATVIPDAAPLTERKTSPLLKTENIDAALKKAFGVVAPALQKTEVKFREVNKGTPAPEVAAEFRDRLEKLTDFLFNDNSGAVARLTRAQSTGQMVAVLDKISNEAKQQSKTMQPVINAYLKAFTDALSVSEPDFFVQRLAAKER